MKRLFPSLIRITSLRWQRVLEDTQIMKGYFQKVSFMISSGLTKEMCIAAYLVSRELYRLGKKSGWLFVSYYCKYASASLQRHYSGKKDIPYQPFPISLNRSGCPRIIPPFHRLKIAKRDDYADMLVKFYMSVFSLTKVIPLAKKVSHETFDSIVTPLTDEMSRSVDDIISNIILPDISSIIGRYMPDVHTIPLYQGMTWSPTWKALPSYAVAQYHRLEKSSYLFVPFEVSTFAFLLNYIAQQTNQTLQIMLWPQRTIFALDDSSSSWFKDFESSSSELLDHLLVCEPAINSVSKFGRIGQSVEGRAKRRIFAIGNYVNQRLLRPIHDWLMENLRRLRMDGTFHQTKPLTYITNRTNYFCYDLSAATDRLPLIVLSTLISHFFGDVYSSAIVKSALATNVFDVPFVVGSPPEEDDLPHPELRQKSVVSFMVGQPLGYYSSWPLFALAHHLLVWCSAQQVYPGTIFRDYALLGDDIVIADESVAKEYRSIMARLGVKISDIKSLVSDQGGAEFAKRFLVKGLKVDCSPISIKNLLGSHHPMGVYALKTMYPKLSENSVLRLMGAGYKVRAHPHKSARKYQRALVMIRKCSLPTDLWLAHDSHVCPYSYASTFYYLLDRVKPKQPTFPFQEMDNIDNEEGGIGAYFMEVTQVRSHMVRWLKYQSWYFSLLQDLYLGSCSIGDLFDRIFNAPVVITSWKLSKTDLELVKFGNIWKAYDYYGKLKRAGRPGILPCPFRLGVNVCFPILYRQNPNHVTNVTSLA